jgi:hypothetical protein
MTDNTKAVDELHIDRSHIECDCCGKPGPTKNCSRCLSYYYCNRQCQMTHWKNHKQQCAFLKGIHDTYKKKKRIGDEFLEEKEKGKSGVSDECAICLEDIELPISLDCGHVFCVQCLMQHKAANNGKGSCPNCRGDVDADQIGKTTADQMIVYVERAKRSDGAEREVYVNLALRQIDAALKTNLPFGLSWDKEFKDQLQVAELSSKITAYEELKMYREVIETVDKFMNLCANTEYVIGKEIVLDVKISNAKAHLKSEEWKTALDMFKLLLMDAINQQHSGFCSDTAAGISRAQYELHNYHEASVNGYKAAWRGNRYRKGVHKYIALSQMKLGDIAEAKKTITRGLLLEEQWNEENKKENEEVLRMILAEEAKNNKPKGKKKGKNKKGRGKK